jgi:hypothetical protein
MFGPEMHRARRFQVRNVDGRLPRIVNEFVRMRRVGGARGAWNREKLQYCEFVHMKRSSSLVMSDALETGGTSMIRKWTSRQLRLPVAIVTLIGVAAFVSIGLAHPKPTSDGGLGAGWECSKTAGMLTVCTRVARARPASVSARNDLLRLPQA